MENERAYQNRKQLIAKYQVSGVAVHDARLVAMMLAHDVNRVLTINDRDFSRYAPDGIVVLLP